MFKIASETVKKVEQKKKENRFPPLTQEEH